MSSSGGCQRGDRSIKRGTKAAYNALQKNIISQKAAFRFFRPCILLILGKIFLFVVGQRKKTAVFFLVQLTVYQLQQSVVIRNEVRNFFGQRIGIQRYIDRHVFRRIGVRFLIQSNNGAVKIKGIAVSGHRNEIAFIGFSVEAHPDDRIRSRGKFSLSEDGAQKRALGILKSDG